MNYNKRNIIKNKYNSLLFEVLYLIVLATTSFHFHVSDIADINDEISQTKRLSGTHLFTSQECPIIIFANNGFNSIQIHEENILENLEVENNYFLQNPSEYCNHISYHFTIRGPPLLV